MSASPDFIRRGGGWMANMEQSDVMTTAGSQIFPQNLRTEFLLLCHKKHLAESQHNMVKDLPART